MVSLWKHTATVTELQPYEIEGISIWESSKWKNTGERITVKDPVYGQSHALSVYETEINGRKIRFGITEFSNSVYGIYRE